MARSVAVSRSERTSPFSACVSPVSGVAYPDLMPGHEAVRLGAQVPFPGLFRAFGGETEADAGVVVGVRVELAGSDDDPQPGHGGEEFRAQGLGAGHGQQ